MSFRFVLAVLLLLPAVAGAKAHKSQKLEIEGPSASSSDTELIDTPTASIIEYYGLQVQSRFFSNGGVLGSLGFGVLPKLNLGASMIVEQLIGTGEAVRPVRPEIQAKFRFYEGARYVPAMSVGYDGQGYYYNRDTERYQQKGRGLYLVGSYEPMYRWQVSPGINMSDFNSDGLFMFANTSLTIEDTLALMLEWDNVQRIDQSRLNAGVRFYVTQFFNIDLAVRDIGANDTFADGSRRRPERIVKMRYMTSF